MIEIGHDLSVKDVIDNIAIPQCKLQMMGKDVAIPFLAGKPGCGKTSLLYDACKRNDMNLLHCHFALKPIEDLSGLPTEYKLNESIMKQFDMNADATGTQWTVPDLLTQIYELASDGKETLIFLDDVHRCSEAHFDLGYEMFTEKTLRGFKLPENTAFILAGNDSAKAGSKTINSAIVNRCAMYKVSMDFDDWKRYAIGSGINSKIVSFLSNSANSGYFHEAEQVSQSWASPRSWARLGEVLSPMEMVSKLPTHRVQYISAAHVGNEAAAKFAAYYGLFSEVNAEAVFRRGEKYKIPKDLGKLYVFCMAMCYEFFNGVGKVYNDKNKSFNMAGYTDTFAKVVIDVASVSKELALVTIKEVIMTSKLFTRSVKPTLNLKAAMEKIDQSVVDSVFDLINE